MLVCVVGALPVGGGVGHRVSPVIGASPSVCCGSVVLCVLFGLCAALGGGAGLCMPSARGPNGGAGELYTQPLGGV